MKRTLTFSPFLWCFFITQVVAAQGFPVARVIPLAGIVEVQESDDDWRTINEAAILFVGDRVRTLADSRATIYLQDKPGATIIHEETDLQIADGKLMIVHGSVSESQDSDDGFFARLIENLIAARAYVIQTRESQCDPMVRTTRHITLSALHPELVWRNACSDYGYRVIIDDEVFSVPEGATTQTIRFRVKNVFPGEHPYRVQVLDGDQVVYSQATESTFTWIDDDAANEIASVLNQRNRDALELADYLERRGLLVPAMELYEEYFRLNAADNHLRPLLIKSYAELRLNNMQANEVRIFQSLNAL